MHANLSFAGNILMEPFVGNEFLKVRYVTFHKVEAVLSYFGMHPLIAVDLEGDGTEEAVSVPFHFDHFEGWFVCTEDTDELVDDWIFIEYFSSVATLAVRLG